MEEQNNLPPEWFVALTIECQTQNLEIAGNNGRLYILCSKEPSKEFQSRVRSIIPVTVPYEFKAQPKQTTIQAISTLFQRAGVIKIDDQSKTKNHLELEVSGMGPELEERFSQTWTMVLETLHKDEYFQSWNIKLNGTLLHTYDRKIATEHINITRTRCIGDDDIMNLKIDLGNINTIDELIASL